MVFEPVIRRGSSPENSNETLNTVASDVAGSKDPDNSNGTLNTVLSDIDVGSVGSSITADIDIWFAGINSVAVISAVSFLQKTLLSMFGCRKKARAASIACSDLTMACAKRRGKIGSSSFTVAIAWYTWLASIMVKKIL